MAELKWNVNKVGLKKVFALLLAVCVCVTSMGFSANAAGTEMAVKGVQFGLDQTSLSFKTAEEQTVNITGITFTTSTDVTAADVTEGDVVTSLDAFKHEFEATSSNNKVATASVSGNKVIVNPVANGDAIITVKSKRFAESSKTISVKVEISEPEIPVSGVTLDKDTLTLTVGGNATLKATVAPSSATNQTVTWNSTDKSVATVDANGKVTAVKEGKTDITATAGGKTATCKVTVNAATVAVTGVNLNKNTLTLTEGGSEKLTATVAPSTATDKTVTWKSSNATVATVGTDGTVKAVKAGTADITATAGGKTATCKVTVNPKEAPKPAETTIKLSATKKTLPKGKSFTLKATTTNTNGQKVTWKSNKTKVATVDKNGKVTAKAAGKATITATVNGKSAKCVVTVTVPATSVKASASSLYIVKGKSATVKVTVNPTDTTDSVKVSIDSKGKKVISSVKGKKGVYTIKTKKKAGSGTITFNAGGKKVKVKVTVVSKAAKSKSVAIYNGKKKATKATLNIGKSLDLTAKMNPKESTDTLTWKSSNSKVVSVDKYGHITAKKAGTATITVTTSSKKKATCKVTVPGVTLKKTKATIKAKKSTTIAVKSTTVKGDKVKSYKSSNTKVATVTKKGKVTGKKKGTATITVTMKSGATATFKVTVK